MSQQNDSFDLFEKYVGQLLEQLPIASHALGRGDPFASDKGLPGWPALQNRYKVFREYGGTPTLVVTLFGPSGAGKSTLFLRLTGISVARGATRPQTRVCTVAISPQFTNASKRLAKLFPGFEPVRLQNKDDPKRQSPNGIGTRLYYGYHTQKQSADGVDMVLVDVPDMNSVERENWDRARQMLQRAEVVVFVCDGNGYADEKVIQALYECSQLAAYLVFVITRKNRAEAEEIWQDLGVKLSESEPGRSFREVAKEDGNLLSFLTSSHCYFSPYQDELDRIEVLPLGAAPPLQSLLGGLDGRRLLLRGLLAPAELAAISAMELFDDCDRERATLVERQKKIYDDVANKARFCVESPFPKKRFSDIVLEVAERHKPNWYRNLMRPLASARYRAQKLKKWGSDLIKVFRESPKVKPLSELQKERLSDISKDLVEKWLKEFDDEGQKNRPLENFRVTKRLNDFQNTPLPPPGENWEEVVRTKADKWAVKNSRLIATVMTLKAGFMTLGMGALALGLLTIVRIVSLDSTSLFVLAGGSFLIALVIHLIYKRKLKSALDSARNRWCEEQARIFQSHLKNHLADPLFAPWWEKLERLEKIPREGHDAAKGLNRLADEEIKADVAVGGPHER